MGRSDPSPAKLLAEATVCDERDVALRLLVANASLRLQHFFNYEWLHDEKAATAAQLSLTNFLGVDL